MPRMTGAKYLAETLKAYGVSHVFLVPAVLRKSLAEMDMVGINGWSLMERKQPLTWQMVTHGLPVRSESVWPNPSVQST